MHEDGLYNSEPGKIGFNGETLEDYLSDPEDSQEDPEEEEFVECTNRVEQACL